MYKCSVDNNAVSIQWIVNGLLSTLTDLGIITYGAGTQNSSVTIPGNPELNNTIVTCIVVDGFTLLPVFTSSATLLIQGMVMSVVYTQ